MRKLSASLGLAAILSVITGCGSTATTGGDGGTTGTKTCAQRSGTYRHTYTEKSGTCGLFPEQITSLTEQPKAPESPCTGTIKYSTDNCQVTVDASCPTTTGGTLTQRGVMTWSENGDTGEGEFQIGMSGTGSCSSIYKVNGVRIAK